MFVKSTIALAVAASSVAAAPLAARWGKQPPAGWAYDYLEDYMTYHTRYLALECYKKHDTSFFSDCCSPLLKTETLSQRPEQCTPSQERTDYVYSSLSVKYNGGATSTAAAAAPKESEGEWEEYCESEAVAAATSTAPAAYSPAAVTESPAASPAWSPAAAASESPASQVGQEYHAPAPSSAQPTTTTPAWTPEPTTQAPAPQTTQQAQQSSGGETFTGGYATFFSQGGNAGACGIVHQDSDYVIAIDYRRWGSSNFGGGSDTCGRSIRVTNTNNGRSVTAVVQDVCPSCNNGNSLDLSIGAFNAIATPEEGMVPISWQWI